MKLYMVRHGQSVANLNKQHVGWGQVLLTEKGEDDARGAGEILKNYSFDKVYSSDLLRASSSPFSVNGTWPQPTCCLLKLATLCPWRTIYNLI